ncbi:HAD-IA family hydrolase [Streptacidiphilus sp. 4-A2]|nr:HAD-IA family hydrolase [Streptacidiphilus sp. 4-A2]
MGQRPGRWSGTVMELLDRVCPGHGYRGEQVSAALTGIYPWHRADQAHPQLSEPHAWWQRMTEVIGEALVRLGLPPTDAATAAGLVRAQYTDPEHWSLYDDTLPVLEELSSLGWRHAVLSNHVPELPILIRFLGLAPHLEAVVNSAVTGYEKPHPEAFRIALAATGDPEQVWMIGDNPTADIAGAHAAGIRAILVRTPDPGVPRHAPDLTALPALLAAEYEPHARR